jgi:hypothetical protein
VTQKTWTKAGVDCPAIIELLGNHLRVAAVYQGHDHETDGTKFASNTNYAWDGRFGGSFGVHYNGYRVTELRRDGSIFTYQYDPATSSIVNSNRLEFSKGFKYPEAAEEVIVNSTDTAVHGSQALKLQGAEPTYGVFVKVPLPEDKYVLESWVSSTVEGSTPAVGIGLVSAAGGNPSTETGTYVQGFLYYSDNRVYTDVVTDSVRDRAFHSFPLAAGTWYKFKITLDGAIASFYSPSGDLLRTVSYDPAKLFPAFPEFRHEGPSVGYFDLYTIRRYASREPTYAIEPVAEKLAEVVASGGTPQSTTIRSVFAQPLEVTVRDTSGIPVDGVVVVFHAPDSGASASLSNGGVAKTDTDGHARVTATANATAGEPYEVTATAGTLDPARFTLTNQQAPVPLLNGHLLLGLCILVMALGVYALLRS